MATKLKFFIILISLIFICLGAEARKLTPTKKSQTEQMATAPSGLNTEPEGVIGTIVNQPLFDHSHSLFNDELKKYVVSKGATTQVNYPAWKADRKKLNLYIGTLSMVNKADFDKWSQKKQLAFLINAYNAHTISLVLNHYPIDSIKDIGSFFSSPFKKEFFSLFGRKMSLHVIEHEILRVKYKEPRIHFAINCASIGCPKLAKTVFTEENLESMLEQQTKEFLTDSTRNKMLAPQKKLELSKIFSWFEEDFQKKSGSVLAFVAPYMTDDENLAKTIVSEKWRIEHLSYDWNLNKVQ